MDRITMLNGTSGRGAMLKAGAQHLELFEFATSSPKVPDPGRLVCDLGITHFCVEVDDIEKEYRRLSAAGVQFHCEPQVFGSMKATYAHDPDGNTIELLQNDLAEVR